MKGLAELLQDLKDLDANVNSEARIAAAAGAKLVKKEAVLIARAQGLVDTGALVKNIAIKREPGTPRGIHEYHIGVRHGPQTDEWVVTSSGKRGKKYSNNPFYWWFWEFGHFNTFLGRHVAAKPFIRPALVNKQGEVIDAMKARLAARIKQHVRKSLS